MRIVMLLACVALAACDGQSVEEKALADTMTAEPDGPRTPECETVPNPLAPGKMATFCSDPNPDPLDYMEPAPLPEKVQGAPVPQR